MPLGHQTLAQDNNEELERCLLPIFSWSHLFAFF